MNAKYSGNNSGNISAPVPTGRERREQFHANLRLAPTAEAAREILQTHIAELEPERDLRKAEYTAARRAFRQAQSDYWDVDIELRHAKRYLYSLAAWVARRDQGEPA